MISSHQKLSIAFLMCALFTFSHSASEVRKMRETPAETVKTICVGRFLLDVPADAAVEYGRTRISGLEVQTDVHESDDQFAARLGQTEKALATERNERGGTSLELSIPVSTSHLVGKIFVYGRQWIKGISDGKAVYSETTSIRGIGRSHGVTFDFHRELGKPRHIEQLERLMRQLEWRSPDSVPSSAGFCFDHGLALDPLDAAQSEFIVMFISVPKYPDLAIALSSAAGRTAGKSLLERDAESNSIKKQYPSHFYTLRRRARSLKDLPGEELLDRVSELNRATVHDFMWELQGQKNDVNSPALLMELSTGRGAQGSPLQSSLSDQEALRLWDKISESLRRRPVGNEVNH